MKRSAVDLTPAELDKLARDAWGDAARQALERGLPISGSRNGRRFRHHPDGHLEDVGPVDGTLTDHVSAVPNNTETKLYFQNRELPEAYQEMAAVKRSQANDAYQEAEAVLNRAFSGANEYAAKLFDIVRANSDATMDFAQQLVGVTSLSQAMDLWTTHARKQFEALTAQAKELAELTRHLAEDAKPRGKAKDNVRDSSKPFVA
jgi:hypothetical protein